MRTRIAAGLSLALCAAGACLGAVPEGGARGLGEEPGADALATRGGAGDAGAGDAGAGDAGDPHMGPDGGCRHGALEDPHRGFVRCLAPEEADAGWLPPASQPPDARDGGAAPTDGGAAPADGGAAPAGPPPIVEVQAPSFVGGDVPDVDKKLQKLSAEIARCVAEHGGLTGAAGSLEVQFLVRARGRAEGVEILRASGVSAEARSCVRLLLKNKPVGAPSADPVGVTVKIALKPAK